MKKYIDKSCSDRIREMHKSEEKTLKEFVNQIDVSYSAAQRYAAGDSEPSFAFLKEVARLGYSVDWLITGQGSMYRSPGSEQVTLTAVQPKALPPPDYGQRRDDDDLLALLLRALFRRFDPELQALALPVLQELDRQQAEKEK